MKILVVTQYFYPENFKINDLVLGLRSLGHEIVVFTGKPNYPKGDYFPGYGFFAKSDDDYNGIRVIRCPLIPRGKSKITLLLNYISFVLFGSISILRLRKEKFDHIFVYEVSPITVAIPAIFYRYLSKIKLSFWVTDLWPESLVATGVITSPTLLKPVDIMVNWIYARCDQILVSSNAYFESVSNHCADKNKIKYFPQWAENYYIKISEENIPSEHRMRKNGLTLMFAGNLGVAQALSTLVDCVEYLDDLNVEFVIVGDGRDKRRLQKQIDDKNLNSKFVFLGAKNPEVMSYYFAQADALLITLRDEAIFALTIPAKLQSYLAVGKPVLGAISGEGQKIIKESMAGDAVNAEDSRGLAEIIKKFASCTKDEREKLGHNALDYYAKNFDRDRLITQLSKSIETLK